MALLKSIFGMSQHTNICDIFVVENKYDYRMIRKYDLQYSEYISLDINKISIKHQHYVEYINSFLYELNELVHKPYMNKVKNIDVFLDRVKITFDNGDESVTDKEINCIKELIGGNIANEILKKIK